MERQRGRLDWARQDGVVEAAQARGLRVLATVAYAPAWAMPDGTDSSIDPAEYARFAAEAVRRYGPRGVRHFELWNEPNSGSFWKGGPDVAAYSALVEAAYRAMKRVDPDVVVLAGGLAPGCSSKGKVDPADFLAGMYEHGAGDSFDALSHHPYSFPALPGGSQRCNGWHQLEGTESSLRGVLEANGDGGKETWATEFGAPVDEVGEDGQADQLSAAAARWTAFPWAGPLFVYAYRDRANARFNLVREDWSRRPAWAAYRDAIAASR